MVSAVQVEWVGNCAAKHAPTCDDLVNKNADGQDGQMCVSFHVFPLLIMAIDMQGWGQIL